jgi:hypothetical protein
MTSPTEKGWPGWIMPTALVALLLAGWVGGVAFFAMPGGWGAGTQAAEGTAVSHDTTSAPSEGEIPEAVLGPLGGLIGANLHQSYLNIGFLADAVEGQLYSDEEALSLLAAVSALIDTTSEQIDKLPADALPPDDRHCIEQFRAVVGPMKVQVKELRLHWETDKKAHAQRFQQARSKAQAALEALVRR